MKLSIVIVSWNVKAFLLECLASILRHPTTSRYEIIVVDNASSDGTADAVAQAFPSVRLLINTENLGFAQANNQGAKLAQGEFLFILNPDTLLMPGTLDELVAFMERHLDISMTGPRILNNDGTIQRSVRGFPTWQAAFGRQTLLKYVGLFKSSVNQWRRRDFDYSQQADVDQLIGAALFVRREIFERIGRFDERFFMYYEEVDLCKRFQQQGHRVVYYPGAELVHLGGKSSKQVPAKKKYMLLDSLVLYLTKHGNRGKAWLLAVLFKVSVLALQGYEWFVFGAGYCLCSLIRNKQRAAKCGARSKSAFEFLIRYYPRWFCGIGAYR